MTTLWKAPTVVPTLAVADVAASVAWLSRAFGFRERADARLSWPSGGSAWLELDDDALINLVSDGSHGLRRPRDGSSGIGLKVYVDDVDRHFERAKAEGARITSGPQDGFWGGRIYRVQDLDGHHWEFSQRGRDLAHRAWQLPPGVTMGA